MNIKLSTVLALFLKKTCPTLNKYVWCTNCLCVWGGGVGVRGVLHCGWHFFWNMKIKCVWNRVIQGDAVLELHLTCLLCNLAFSISPTICLTPPTVPLAISAHFLTLLSGTLLIHPLSSNIYIYIYCVCVCVCVCVFNALLTVHHSNISIIQPTRCTFHSIHCKLKAPTCFEHYLLILRRCYTNGIWYIMCVCQFSVARLQFHCNRATVN
jgi:hypothetical protein